MGCIEDIFELDREKEKHGVWISLRDMEFLIAPADNEAYMAAMRERSAPHRIALAAKVADETVFEKIHIDCIASKILLDWKGVQDEATKETVPYTWQRGVAMLTAQPRFRTFILENAARLEIFRKKDRETVEKNS